MQELEGVNSESEEHKDSENQDPKEGFLSEVDLTAVNEHL